MSLAYFDTAMGFVALMLLLSMLVTILVQITVAAANLRGRNLLWGLERLTARFVPEYKAQGRALAQRVLTHDALSHSFGRYAEAIRPQELMLVLQDLSTSQPPANDKLGLIAKDAATKVLAETAAAQERVEVWFNTIMDRTTERFVVKTRLLTAVFSFGIALVMNIDTPYIVRELSTKPEVTQAVINAALNNAVPLYTSLSELEPLPLAAVHALASQYPAQAATLQAATGLATQSAAVAWIKANFTAADLQGRLLSSFDAQLAQMVPARLQQLTTQYQQVGGWVRGSQLSLSPSATSYCDKPVEGAWLSWWHCSTGTRAWWSHLLGMLITGMLLSLGAPFWFNALRNMSNLRPILAGKVDADKDKA